MFLTILIFLAVSYSNMAWTAVNVFAVMLHVWAPGEVLAQELYRDSCQRFGSFENSDNDRALVGHEIITLLAEDAMDCGRHCLAHENCLSYNYQTARQVCQLNRSNRQSNPEALQYTPGFRYYGSTRKEMTGPGCLVNPCFNSGTCVDTCYGDMFTCQCTPLYTGKLCHKPAAKSCKELKELGFNQSAKWPISPGGQGMKLVYCDQDTDGGGWTVIQRRQHPFRTNFDKSWHEYRMGFGNPYTEFWLGNDAIHQLTKSGDVQLLVELRESGGKNGTGLYQSFSISDADDKFRLCLGNFLSGGIKDSMNAGRAQQSGMQFSTRDKDYDGDGNGSCATDSGWWFNHCVGADLNSKGKPKWSEWSFDNTVSYSEMKIR